MKFTCRSKAEAGHPGLKYIINQRNLKIMSINVDRIFLKSLGPAKKGVK